MSAIIILFCLLNFAASIKLRSTVSDVDVNKGRSIQLKWEITKNAGENYISATIKLVPPGKAEINVALFVSEFVIQPYPDYSKRGWTVSHASGSPQIVLNIQNAQEVDDGVYNLDMHYTGSNGPTSAKLGIRLNVLVKPYYETGSYDSGTKTANEGDNVVIKCRPEGTPKPITIIWEKNNVRFKTTNTDDPDLVFNNVTRNRRGGYVCKASNKAGSAEIEPSTQLEVKYKPVNTKFNTTSVLVVGKTNLYLECTAEADPPATFRISGGGIAPVTDRTGRVPIKPDLSLDGNIVRCTPSNILGNGPTIELKLDVQVKPTLLAGLPKELDAIEGRNISVTCRASGKPAARIIWLKDGSPLRNTPRYYVTGRRTDNTYVSTSQLTLAPARRTDNGNYGCQAINLHGSNQQNVKLNLLYLPEVTEQSKTNFKNLRVIRKGDNVRLECKAKGNPETTYYVWRWENGTVIQNETTGILEFKNIQPYEGGRLSCAGGNYIGEGEKVLVNVYVRVPPRIIIPPQKRISLNESQRLQLFCNATGVPEPTIYWLKDGKILRVIGDHLSISDVTYTDRGKYTCTADNGINPNVSESSDVTIYFRPVIQTTSAADTLLGAEPGQTVDLVCIAEALPVAKFKWLSYPSMQELNDSLSDIISIKSLNKGTLTMSVKARFGAKYICYVYNNRGNATQLYEIRPKGSPEAPRLDSVKTYVHNVPDQLSTVRADLKWTPGYNGGQKVWYKVYYGSRAEQEEGNSNNINDDCNCFTITQNLEANKDYVFYVQAYNDDGPSNSSNHIRRRTQAFFGSASVERLDEGKIVKVSFVIYTKKNLTKEVRYREKENAFWETRTTNPDVQQPLVIEDLDPDKHYEFRVLWFVGDEQQITDGGEVAPWKPPVSGGRSSTTLSKEEIIAVIAGVGGFLLIVILVLFLCLIRRRQKPKRDETVIVMRRQPQAGDMVTRRSLIGSVEDDPFESAHYGSQEKKKKARDSYYLPDSEDMNTFTAEDDTAKRVSPAEGNQAYQPYKFGHKSQHNGNDRSSSDDDSYRYKKQRLSDDELSSEPGYAKVGANGKILRDNIDGSRDPPQTKQNDVYAKVNNKGNNRPVSNGRGAPPPYRPRSTAETVLPPYSDDHLDLDDPSAVPYDDPLPPPMPVLPNARSIPEVNWNDRYSEEPTLERHKSPSGTSLGGGKPYINAQGKLVRPSSRHSSSDHLSDSEQRLPEPEVPTGRSRHVDLDNDQSNLVSYLV